MNHDTQQHPSRRVFLQRLSQLSLAGIGTPMALNLAAMGEAAAATANDYKALVCVFLYGGNDYANTVITYDDASHAQYARIRAAGAGSAAGNMVISKEALQTTLLRPHLPLANGRAYALHPSMGGLAQLFNNGKAAIQLNVGPLVVPLTRAQYNSGNTLKYPLPPKLFSHNDQQSIWQSLSPEGSTVGWGGRLGDQVMSGNTDSLFTCISVTGNSVFLSGNQALQYQCSASGAIAVKALQPQDWMIPNAYMREAFQALIQQSSPHALKNAYTTVMKRAIVAESKVSNAIGQVQLRTGFSTNNLSNQLKMVARLMGARQSLANKRQVFMVSIGGFDLHDNLVSKQPGLLREVDTALSSFFKATEELGISEQVTTFTASDFGRTLTSNGDGSDHGWGSHHVVMGGGLKGAHFYGEPPPVSANNSNAVEDQWHVGQGSLLPRTSTDQFAATLARWFGVAEQDLGKIFPNLKNFGDQAGRPDYPSDLGYF